MSTITIPMPLEARLSDSGDEVILRFRSNEIAADVVSCVHQRIEPPSAAELEIIRRVTERLLLLEREEYQRLRSKFEGGPSYT